MGFLYDNCTFCVFDEEKIKTCDIFSCDHEDLDDFFNNDALDFGVQLLGKSYCFTLNENPKIITCAFTVSNSSIRVDDMLEDGQNNVRKNIPEEKRLRSYPAVLVGRLGVNKDYQKHGIGQELMDYIKMWFTDPHNKTGCRFIIVDAYNNDNTIKYYINNGFEFTFPDETTEKEYYGLKTRKLKTRSMIFDLIKIKV